MRTPPTKSKLKKLIFNFFYRFYRIYRGRWIYIQKREYEKIALKYFKNTKRILDIGCGAGEFINLDPKRIKGLDRNKENIKACQQKGFRVTEGDATNLPFEDNSFDGIYSGHLIEHLMPEDSYKFLKEIDRVLKKNGIFVITAPLFHKGFHDDLTHTQPYPPKAIFHYLRIFPLEKNTHYTKEMIDCLYKVLYTKYRHRPFFKDIEKGNFWFLAPLLLMISNILEKIKITWPEKTGYLIVMKKIK